MKLKRLLRRSEVKINPEAFRFYLRRAVPRKTLPALAKETGIDLQKLEKALEEEVSFSYRELRKLGKGLGTTSWMLMVEPEYVGFPKDLDRWDFRQLARTRKNKKVVWFDVFPESDRCAVIDTPHTGLHYLKDPLSPVLQCTGLKDERGIPIWEGDIVEVWYDDHRYAKEIVWIEDKAGFGYKYLSKVMGKLEECAFTFAEMDYYRNVKVIGNKFIASLEIYRQLVEETFDQLEIEIDEITSLRSIIYTGKKRPDGDDVVLYLERDWDTGKIYLTDLGETDMFIATHKDLEESKEFKVEVDEKNVLERMWKLLEAIEERFEKELKGFRFGG